MTNRILILTEKPSAAREVASALLGTASGKGALFRGTGPNGDELTVAAARGHVLELAKPGAYSELHGRDFGLWRPADLPITPRPGWEFDEIPRGDAADLLRSLKAMIADHVDCEVVNACDSGREGELIFRKILYSVGAPPAKLSRMWFSSMTGDALRDSFQTRRQLSQYDGLGEAGFTRDQADWLVGMNLTVLATKTLKRGHGSWKVWSIGRVQTPTLALLVERDETIQNFVPQSFFEVYGVFGGVTAKASLDAYAASADRIKLLGAPKITEERDRKAFWDEKRANAFCDAAKAPPRYVMKQGEGSRSARPPLPLDLQEAQKFCSKKFGMTAKGTLELLQRLYEAKLISYPRTDSRYLNEDMRGQVYGALGKSLAWLQTYHSNLHLSQQELMPKELADASKA